MYDPQLEKLVDMALVDGVITEKEKDILVKRAKSLGADLDEFEMYLDARLASSSNTQNPTVSQKKLGDLLKCPSCGANVPSLTIICKDCGFEFRNTKANSSVKELSEKLEQASLTVVNEEKTFSDILNLNQSNWLKVDDIKSQIVTNFPIPNTKDDLLEFAIFISSNITSYKGSIKSGALNGATEAKKAQSKEKWNDIWIEKYKQIIYKAKILCKDEPSFAESIINLVIKRQIKIKTEFGNWFGTIILSYFFVSSIGGLFFLVFVKSIIGPESGDGIIAFLFPIVLSTIPVGIFLDYKYGSKLYNWDE